MRFFLVATNVLAEIEAPSALAATFDVAAEDAPRGSALVELRTGKVVARRDIDGWVFGASEACASRDDRRGAA